VGNSKNSLPYYPDPLAREAFVRVLEHDMPATADCECEKLEFYANAADGIEKARPVLIELVTFKPQPNESLHKISRPTGTKMPTIRVHLAEAADLDFLLWSSTDDDECLVALRPAAFAWTTLQKLAPSLKNQLKSDAAVQALQGKSVATALAAAIEFLSKPHADRMKISAEGRKPLVEVVRAFQGPIPTIADQRRLRVVRPVEKPLQPPCIAKVNVVCGTKAEPITRNQIDALLAVRVLSSPAPTAGSSAPPPDHWANYVTKHLSENPLCYESEEGANQTFFVGTACVHRASTGKARFDATWREFNDDIVFSKKDGIFHHVPSSAGPATFSIEKFSREATGALSDLDLLRDETGALRGLKIDFPDTRARKVTFSLHGISRFTEFYPPVTSTGDKKFESHDSKHDVTLWVPSTARPASPVVDRILPVFRWLTDPGSDNITVTREVALRIYLKRPWHSAGEGERLAVICWPPNIFVDGTADEVARCTLIDRAALNVINPKEEFLTRWGADPIHLSGDITDLIPADQFKAAELRVGDLLLSLPHRDSELPGGKPQLDIDKGCPNDPPDSRTTLRNDNPGTAGVKVAVAAYTPQVDPQTGDTWYCDLPITAGDSYFPFIRLGLARYQPHSIKDRELSYPVAEWAQIPPVREARINYIDEHTVLVVVKGIGYHESNGSEIPAERDILDRPRLRIRVCRSARTDQVPADGETISWMPVVVNGMPLDFPRLRPTISGNTMMWVKEIKLPPGKVHEYAVIIEEFEVMVADGEVIGDVVTRERGPMFACTIPFTARSPGKHTPPADTKQRYLEKRPPSYRSKMPQS
jgi:hypothetical protein